MREKKWLSVLLCLALLCAALSVGLTPTAAAGLQDYVTGATPTALTEVPTGTSLIAGLLPGTAPALSSGAAANITDGKYPGLNQKVQAKFGPDGKTLNVRDDKPAWGIQTDANDIQAAFKGANSVQLVYDMGGKCDVTSVVIGSTAEPKSITKDSADAMSKEDLEQWILDNTDLHVRLLKGSVYISNTSADLFENATKAFSWDYTNGGTINYKETDAPLVAQYTLSTAVAGRYIGFKVDYDSDGWAWASQARFGELAVFGETKGSAVKQLNAAPEEDSLILGKTPTDSVSVNSGAIANATDGKYPALNQFVEATRGPDGKTVNVNDDKPHWGIKTNANDIQVAVKGGSYVDLIYDMGVKCRVESVVINSTAEPAGITKDNADAKTPDELTAWLKENTSAYVRLHKGEVYVAGSKAALFNDSTKVVAWDYTEGGTVGAKEATTPLAAQYTLETPKSGRYVAFRLYIGDDWGWSGLARIGELGVFGKVTGTPTVDLFTPIRSEDDLSKLPAMTDNLLLGKAISGNKAGHAPVSNGNGGDLTDPNLAGMFDGVMTGVNGSENKGSFKDRSDLGIQFDLRGRADISEIFIHGNTNDNDTNRIHWAKVFISNDKTGILETVPTAEFTFTESCGYLMTLPNPINGRYVTILTDHDATYGLCRIGELAVWGEYIETPTPLTSNNLLLDTLPVKQYLAYAGDPARESGYFESGRKNDGVTLDPVNMTNGNYNDLYDPHCWYGANNSGVNLVNWEGVGYNTHWPVIIFSLGGMANIKTIKLVSADQPGYYVAGVRYYIADRMANLFKKESLVYDTQGDKTTTVNPDGKNMGNEDGLYLDPKYDKTTRELECDLGAGKEARYVAFVITRPYPCRTKGWSVTRIAELEVTGTAPAVPDPPFDESKATVTDPNTGISLTINRKDIDDIDFYNNLGGLRVTKSALPSGINDTKIIGGTAYHYDKNWLTIDSQMYTLEVYDKSGQTVSAAAIGDRWLSLNVPTDASYFQMLGLVENGSVYRIVNSYTGPDNKSVLAGNPPGASCCDYSTLTGNGLKIVLLKYNDLATINKLNGDENRNELKLYTVNGAAASGRTPFVWLIIAAVAVLITAGSMAVLLLRRRRARDDR